MEAAPASQLDICASCGKMFARMYVKLCNSCAISTENRFALVREYLRANPGKSISEVAEATGLSRGEISKFYDDKRLVGIPETGVASNQCTCTPSSSEKCNACRRALSAKFLEVRSELGGSTTSPRRGAPASESKGERVQYIRRYRRTQDPG